MLWTIAAAGRLEPRSAPTADGQVGDSATAPAGAGAGAT
jgi:hypothetical protein